MNTSRKPLDPAILQTALVDNGPYNQLNYQEATGSTNADLIKAAEIGAPDWTIATVERQDSGRGRLGRPWTAPQGAQVIFSVLFRPGKDSLDSLGTIPLASGLAMMDTLESFGVEGAGLKWPNDVLIHGKKLCGILVEAASLDTDPAVVIGIGTNISLQQEELPVPHATSLALEGKDIDRNEFLIRMLNNLYGRLLEWAGGNSAGDSKGNSAWLDDYRAVCSSLGQDVRVILPGDRELLGVATGIAAGGQLIVRDNQGTEHTLNAGEVTHLRLQ
ncbi:biotin--[acetyl-CoA-carboxylase] ligase [Corynebacterium callunae]|uniref:biotin--[acetyl-CoA-carboxylase] ligase n=1 Tax=Corynebacterium callunae TaxID=1721 RepID=UPI003981F633